MVTTLWAGLALGAIYAMTACGFNVAFVASGTFNFAQPQFLMLGAFVTYAAASQWNLPVYAGLLIGMGIGFVVGALEEVIAIRPLAGAQAHGELVTTVGWAVIMQGTALLIWGPDAFPVNAFGSSKLVDVFGGRLSVDDIVLIGLAIVLAVMLHLILTKSKYGLASLASAEDRQAAMVRGINTRLLSTMSFAAAGGMMGALGSVVAPTTFAVYTIGSLLVLRGFVALAIGGFGSFPGALIGGFVVGIFEAEADRYWGTDYLNLTVFCLLLVVLIIRPQGLFGLKSERRI
jgi:branched-chain amino acid transport system permease protein